MRAESFDYVAAREEQAPLVIPASAPLITGERAVVYVKVAGAARPTFEGRTIQLGPRAGDYYLVCDGLHEGEQVVTNGNFKIDSALQIKARPSMMSPGQQAAEPPAEHAAPAEETRAALPAPTEFRARVAPVWGAYRDLHEALACDDAPGAAVAVSALREAFDAFDADLLRDEAAGRRWAELAGGLETALEQMAAAGRDMAAVRGHLPSLTDGLARTIAALGPADVGPVYRLHCPMASDGAGADWLQADAQVRNPYFGSSMLTCGEVTGQIPIGTPQAEGGR